MESVLYRRIKELCQAKGITVAKLESDLGFSNSTIRKWDNNVSPSIDKIIKIAKYFGVSADYILGITDIQDSADVVINDRDIISFQRAKERMTPHDSQRMMQMLRLAFYYAFDDENEGKTDND